ncbi:DUF5444 family protein [[Erwinia] mediterraneensis]|uniref:DUF5444 family protein n=1 Tax=[Erwinia] mediterraneensis TaxID=2161819 RepID=UPI0010304C70|nr:DUF5444 family protein [[Erwinia] mediterraneensis]
MTIIPVNGTILVQQGNREFNKLYEESFPDTKEGMNKAVMWASAISLGWHDCQDQDWEKHHAA